MAERSGASRSGDSEGAVTVEPMDTDNNTSSTDGKL